MLEPFLISDQLHCYKFFGFMIETFQGLTETTFSEKFNYFKSESYVILHDNLIVTSFIVKTEVVRVKRRPFDFLGTNA